MVILYIILSYSQSYIFLHTLYYYITLSISVLVLLFHDFAQFQNLR